MKNRISLSGMANDVRRLGRPVRRVLAVFVVACVVVLLLAAGSPPLQAQARTDTLWKIRPGASCGQYIR